MMHGSLKYWANFRFKKLQKFRVFNVVSKDVCEILLDIYELLSNEYKTEFEGDNVEVTGQVTTVKKEALIRHLTSIKKT